MSNGTVINICFHGIGTPQRELEPGEDRYWVSEELFLAVLDEVREWPAVRLSFDDGNTSDVEIGLPALLARGLTADFFVLAARLESAGSLDEKAVRQLHDSGMGIGSHGMWHRPWRGMDPATSDAELVQARDRLAAVVGTGVDTAACPLGRYDRRLLGRMRQLGYTRVFTSDRRRARAGSWLQPRYSVRRDDTPGSLRAEALVGPGPLSRLKLEAVGTVKRLR
ncbi:polysaccharide deacetylase family protein [Actinoplanes sp. NPDC049599]|uniref:polysaccharide deacetylase family protein n=1 Tax=Actinoplanes sp. NPDC049599 TaxID=3363903 RepID=UPI0037B4D90A